MIYTLACTDENLQMQAGEPHCLGGWTVVQLPEQSGFDFSELDPIEFKAGLSATLGIFAIGFIAGVVISLLKKAR